MDLQFWLAIVLQAVIILTALFVKSIEDIVGLFGSFLAATISCCFPALAYIVTVRKHGTYGLRA